MHVLSSTLNLKLNPVSVSNLCFATLPFVAFPFRCVKGRYRSLICVTSVGCFLPSSTLNERYLFELAWLNMIVFTHISRRMLIKSLVFGWCTDDQVPFFNKPLP